MPNLTLYEQLEKSHRKTLREIAGDSDSWKRFLDSAGYTYRQSFKNQVAMYSQKPGMKAVLTEKRWEDMNRAVKGGTTGVRIFDDKSPNHISYVYDYADTVPGSPPPGPRPWTVHKNKSGIALHNLLKRTGEKNLDSYIRSRVQKIVDSEVLPNAAPSVKAALQHCLEQSAMYVACKRLGLPTDDIDIRSFSFVVQYQNRPKVLEKLGTLLNHTLRACLEPVRSVAYSMNMTMPAPEEIAAQAKQPEPSAAPAVEATPQPPDLTKASVRLDGDTITIGNGEATHEIDVAVSDEDHAAMLELAKAKQPVKHRPPQAAPDTRYEQLSLDEAPAQNAAKDYGFEYQLLDRLRTDCDYFLGAGNRSEKQLWAGSVQGQIAKMRELYDLLPEKPEWLTLDDISKYAQRMESGGVLSPAETAATPPDSAADHAVEIPVDGEWKKFQTVKEAEHAAYQEWIKEGRKNAVNYISTGDAIPSGGPKARFQDNIAALRLLQHLDATGQQALPDQQRGLARYVGWGGLSDAFDGKKAEWAGEYKTLKELLPAQEYEAARASTLTSFYTPPEIIRTMYETLERFGLKGGNILEPSMGVGAFFANRPASFDTNGTMLYGVELDPVTGRIAQQLFPKANIQITGYEKASLPDSFFDAVVGNVPFGQYKVNDPAFNRYNFLIHDYFAAKNIDKLRVGGIQAIITTSGTTAAGEPLYQTGEEYLSGDVRKKLATAEIFAKQDPGYQVNVDSLKNVQPKDLTASEIELHLGTTWIPPEDIKQFILETMEPNRWVAQSIKVSYNRLNATWNIEGSSVDSYSLKATTTFGTKRKNFYEILRCSLNLQTVKVVDYIEDVDGKKKAVPNVKETRLAQDKQQQIEAAFKDWIYRDPDRRRRLVDYYNTHYNNLRPREYDGSFLRFPGMNPEISLRPHQRNVVARILFGGNTLVAHAVGAGKTMVMGAAAMEKKRLGLCNKTLIIVPNHLTEQMGSELLSLYPNANILVSTRHDFEKNRRKLFCSRIATGNYDIVIMGHSQFSRIPLSIERQQKFLQDEIERYTQEIASAKKEKSGQDLSVKQMEATKKRLQSHLEELMDSPKDDVVTFEQLGVDSLMVDEAHEFKNLAVTTKMQNVAGISTSESQKATDLLMKTQYLDEITGGRGLVFCTGTPISNSPVELYTMMRYLQASTLRAHDLLSFDAWAANFGQTTTSIELAPEGTGYRSKTRFSRFFNLPELISMWKLATDVQTSDMLNLQVPDLEGGKATAVMCPPTELQKESIQALGERAEKVRAGNVDPHTDNMLKITTDGRKLALDQRLLNPLLPDVPENKATACASKVFEIWQNTMATQSTQLIFSDLATPSTGEWNVYDDIRDKLIAKGIPKEQIAFIHDANTDAKKATLFAKVRAGKVRILMGSTQKMGAGTNVQTKLIALHHLDVPWRPSDIEQREGRILRQGNENPSVQIYRYATEGSFDAYSWQLIENKQKFISQIMTSKSPARSCQDLDEVALSYAEIKALCAGNPLIKEKMELDNEVARLSTLRSSHMSQIFELQDKIAIGYPTSIQKVEESLKAISEDMETYKANSRFNPDGSEKFSAIVMGTAYTERKAADAALRDALQGATAGDVIIGQYRGFNIHAYYDAKAVSFMGYLQGEQKYNFEFNPKENFSSFRHLLDKLSDTQALDQERLTILNKNLEDAKKAVNQPFAYEEDFQTKLARLNELNQLLSEDDKTTPKKENPMQKEEYQDLDEFLDDGKIVPANQLPAGWQWEMYNDGSGSLHGPNSERFYSYDLAPYATSGLIEYNATGKGYDTFEGSLDDFRNWAEQQVQAQLEVQKYRTQLNQTYDSMANDPQKYLEYLTFRGQCVGLGAENSVAVFAQNPKATYCPAPEALGSPNIKSGEEDHFVSVLRSDGIERVYALEQYDLPESEYLDNAPLQWTDAQHSDLMHRVEDAAHLANISIVKDIRLGSGFFDAPRNTIHIREGENDTEQLKSLLEGYSEAVIARTNTAEKPVAELESAALAALLQVRCGVPVDGQLSERITTALEDARQVSGFSMKDSVARLHNAMEYCVRYAELEQTSEQYHAQQIEPEAMTPQSEAFMEMM